MELPEMQKAAKKLGGLLGRLIFGYRRDAGRRGQQQRAAETRAWEIVDTGAW
jgi:hypothetical protein